MHAQQPRAGQQDREERSVGEPRADRQGYVLVVDDEPDIRETLREAVEMAGCKAVLAANGADALRLLSERRPCLMILDLIMPVMTGEELLEAMSHQPSLADLPVVISTSAPRRVPAGLPVLPKPIDLNAFWAWLRQNCRCTSVPA